MDDAPGWLRALPTINAAFNATSALLVINGYRLVRRRRYEAHRRSMLAALSASALFLVGYLTLHYNIGSTAFGHQGTVVRTAYLTILGTHTVLAVAALPLVLITVALGLRERRAEHRRIARWTLPVWLYVSLTGVIVYAMLYHVPGAAG